MSAELETALNKAFKTGLEKLTELTSPDMALHLRMEFLETRYKAGNTALNYVIQGKPLNQYLKTELDDWNQYVTDKYNLYLSQPLC